MRLRKLVAAGSMGLVGLLTAVTFLGALAEPVGAHAILTTSTPSDGARLETSPEQVELNFNEGVTVDLGGIAVFDDSGARVDEGAPTIDGSNVVSDLGSGLRNGTYFISFRVVSDDGHPVTGSIVYSVGEPIDTTGVDVERLLGGPQTMARFMAAVARFGAYGAALFAAGVTLYTALARPPVSLRRLVVPLALLGAMCVLALIPLQAVVASGRGARAAVDWDLLWEVITDDVGIAALVTATGLVVIAASRRLAVVGAGAAIIGFAMTGHSRAGDFVRIKTPVDLIHLGAVALWIGGLAVILVALLRKRPDRAAIVSRFSQIAVVAFLLAAGAGVVLAWTEISGFGDLTSTTYGRVLLLKVVLVTVIALLAWRNRATGVPELERGGAGVALTRSVQLEGVLAVAVLVATALLVNLTPARALDAETFFLYTTELGDDLDLEVTVDPVRAGQVNEFHLFVRDESGALADPMEVVIQMELPDVGIEPIERVPFRAGPGHLILSGRELSVPGTWVIRVNARIDQFEQAAATFDLDVRN